MASNLPGVFTELAELRSAVRRVELGLRTLRRRRPRIAENAAAAATK